MIAVIIRPCPCATYEARLVRFDPLKPRPAERARCRVRTFPRVPRSVISRTSLRDAAHRNELLILFPKIIHPFVLWSRLRQKKMICFLYLIRADGRERRCGGSLRALAACKSVAQFQTSDILHKLANVKKKKCSKGKLLAFPAVHN